MNLSIIKRELIRAFPYTIPIFAGFWFLGISYGIYMGVSGFSWVYPTLMALVIFGGSLEFVAVEMLLSAFSPLSVFYGFDDTGKAPFLRHIHA